MDQQHHDAATQVPGTNVLVFDAQSAARRLSGNSYIYDLAQSHRNRRRDPLTRVSIYWKINTAPQESRIWWN